MSSGTEAATGRLAAQAGGGGPPTECAPPRCRAPAALW